MRLAIDAMGGDLAPAEPVMGALAAMAECQEGDVVVLVGDQQAIRQHLDGQSGWERFIRIEHASQIVEMNESPVEAIRQKPNSSIALMAELAKRREVDAIISAGNTGAYVAACQMRLRRLRGVHRPGIAIVMPTYANPVVLIDVGANVNCRPRHLHQYAVMASEYSRHMCKVPQPRVGLLSIGQEDAKGNQLVKETRELLRGDDDIHFVGNVEGRELFHGVCDVLVTEAFVGNVALKLIEGLSEGLFKSLCLELARRNPQLAGQFEKAIVKLREKYDFNEYGGAPLLGVNGICIICHGASRRRAIANAIRVARNFANAHINERITDRIAHCQGLVHE